MEILVADPVHPADNLLGKRDDSPQPFVIEVAELQHGIDRSRFGATRVFTVGQQTLRATIKGSRLGKGVGSGSIYCSRCRNIQEITVDFSIEGR